MSVLKLINRDDPARPLTVKTHPDGSAELRLGDLGITDSVIRLNPAEVWQVIAALDGKATAPSDDFIRVRPCVFTDPVTGRRYLEGEAERTVSRSSPNGRAPFDVAETIEPKIYWLDELEGE